MTKAKAFMFLLIAILVSPFAVSFIQNPQGNSEVNNQPFFVAATRQPNVTTSIQRGGDRFATNVTVIVVSWEQVEVTGVATAEVKITNDNSQTQSSDKITLAPYETRWIYFSFKGIPYADYLGCFGSFKADPIAGSAATSPRATSSGGGGGGGTSGGSSSSRRTTTASDTAGSSDLTLPVIAIVVILLGGVGGFMFYRRGGGMGGVGAEQRIRNLTSYEFQDWVMQKLGARAASVLDARKGIDAFTNDSTPLMIQQVDRVGRYTVDSFMNALVKNRARSGIIVAFGFDFEAEEAARRARMNRIDIRLMTVRELINRGD